MKRARALCVLGILLGGGCDYSSRPAEPGPPCLAFRAVKQISIAQGYLKNLCTLDENANGVGEYGDFKDLFAVKGLGKEEFNDKGNGVWANDGYLFKILLPETASLKETKWCVVAWPDRALGEYEFPTFFMDNYGAIYKSKASSLSGRRGPPSVADVYRAVPFGDDYRDDIWSLYDPMK